MKILFIKREGHVVKKTKDKNFFKKGFENEANKEACKESILNILPIRIREILNKIEKSTWNGIEEIRLRVNKPLIINCEGKDYFITDQGKTSVILQNNIMVNKTDIETGFQLITNYSAYALEEEIKNGFITVRGGHRVGICGKTIIEDNSIKTIKDISGLNIRISREIIGCGEKIIKYLIRDSNTIYNTLIISPPQCGKTTILRDVVRMISNGIPKVGFKGINVSVIDERSEIAGCYNGIPQKDIGIRTDIMDACPKAKGMIMVIRSMSPKVLVTDEIGRDEDVYAIREAINAGVNFITTIHGNSVEEIRRRENIKALIDNKVFERIIVLSNFPRVGTVDKVIDPMSDKVLNGKLLLDGRDNFAS